MKQINLIMMGVLAIASLSGCATIVSGSSQVTVLMSSKPVTASSNKVKAS